MFMALHPTALRACFSVFSQHFFFAFALTLGRLNKMLKTRTPPCAYDITFSSQTGGTQNKTENTTTVYEAQLCQTWALSSTHFNQSVHVHRPKRFSFGGALAYTRLGCGSSLCAPSNGDVVLHGATVLHIRFVNFAMLIVVQYDG